MDWLRAKYLFHLADICGVSPGDVDEMAFVDFLILCDGIDTRIEERKQGAKQGVWVA